MAAQIGIEVETFDVAELSAFGQKGKHIYIVYTDESGVGHVLEGGLYGNDRTHITIREGLLSRDTPPASAVENADGTYIYKSPSNTSTYVALNVQSAVSTWQDMLIHAQAIGAAQLEYVFSPGPNSNSVASSILKDAGFDAEQLLGISIPDDIDPSNVYDKVVFGEMRLSSAGFIGIQNALPSITSDSTAEAGSTSGNSDIGTSGNDKITLSGSGETVDAGSGIDMVVYSTQKSNITKTSNGYSVNGDTLINVERVQFSDTNVALDLDGHAGQTAKILGAVFGKEAVSNKEYAGIGLHFLDSGVSYEALMDLALNAALGDDANDHASVVKLLYKNVLNVDASDSDAEPFIQLLEDGMTKGALGVMAAETSYNTENIDLVGLQETGLAYELFEG